MNRAGGFLSWSFSIGTWFSTTVRVNVLTPLLAVLLVYRLGTEAGLIATAIALLALLAHEFAHIFSARATGGYGDEILISPLGGLAMVQTGGTLLSRVIVPASGPIINLAVCAALVPILYGQDQAIRELMNPLTYSELVLAGSQLQLVCQLAFIINWLLVLINLIPVHPLDGGRILQAVLTEHYGSQISNEIYLKVGTIAGVLFVLGGLMFDSAIVTAIGAFVLVMNLQETYRIRTADVYDDSFMGYDFSQGYTSLERDEDPDGARLGALARWRQARQEKREAMESARAEDDARQLDDILARLHANGYDSLSDAEKRVLKRASNRFRNRQDGT